MQRLRLGTKVVCIANDAHALKKGAAGVPNGEFKIVYMPKLTAAQMAQHLFHEEDWDAVVAKRLAKLSAGDWRQLQT